MNYVIDTIEYKNYTIQIVPDDDPENPREWDNLGTMVCFHKEYNLGDDSHAFGSSDDYQDWDDLEQEIIKRVDPAVILPLSLYDHSGITMRIGSLHGWDSGQVGFIFVSKDMVRKEYNVKRITKAVLLKAELVLRQEVKTYNVYLEGGAVGFRVVNKLDDEIDSCYRYYDVDSAVSEAKSIIDHTIKKEQEKLVKKTTAYIKAHVPLMYRHTEARYI